MSQYIIYTMPNCPDCKNAKDLLTRKGLNFVEVTEFSPQELIDKMGPVRTLPQILIDFGADVYHVGGYRDLVKFTSGEGPALRKLN